MSPGCKWRLHKVQRSNDFERQVDKLQNSHFFSFILDKMNIILLITVTFTLALAHGHNKRPCLPGKDHDFVKRHILQAVLGVDKAEWSK